MKSLRTLIRNTRATTAVEFALIAPVLFFFIFGTLELGRFMFVNNSIDAALAKAGRAWMLDPSIPFEDVRQNFCDRTYLIDCSKVDLTVATIIVNDQEWREIRAEALFESPLYPLIPLPQQISQSEHVPIFES